VIGHLDGSRRLADHWRVKPPAAIVRRLAVALLAVALLAGCSGNDAASGDPSNSNGLADFLPATPGYGFPTTVETQQVMDATEASRALPSGAGATLQELQSLHYRSGFARIWGTSTDYVTMAVLALPAASATDLVTFERQTLAGSQNTYVTSHADIPGSFVFVISSPTQASGSQNAELCNGVWFAYRGYAFESLACGSTPSWATQIEQAAKALYNRARSRAG